jgi:subtilisin
LEAKEAIACGTGRGVRIGVLDSGIEASHPALQASCVGEDFCVTYDGRATRLQPGDGTDLFGHGTAVAGIIRSLAPEAEISSIRVLGEHLESRTAVICEGARAAIRLGCHILNCSFGCRVPEHVLPYKDWVDEAYIRGVHVVAACSNIDPAISEWPGHFSSVVTVDMAMAASPLEILVKRGTLVEFAAHGVDVRVPWKDGTFKRVSGSSFAAPRVAGLLARLLSVSPGLSPLEAKALLHRVATDGTTEGRPACRPGE